MLPLAERLPRPLQIRINRTHGAVVGVLVVIGTLGGIIGGGVVRTPLNPGSVGSTANVWADPAGSDSGTNCRWSASLIVEPSDLTTVCKTLNKMNQLGQAGGLGRFSNSTGTMGGQEIDATPRAVADGTCTVQPTGSGWTDVSNTTGCFTISGATKDSTVNGGISVLSRGVRLKDFTQTNGGISVAWINTGSGVFCTGQQPHDVIIDGLHEYVTGGAPAANTAPNAGIDVTGTYNVAVINNDIGPTYDNQAVSEWHSLHGLGGTSGTTCNAVSPQTLVEDHFDYLGHNYIHDLIQTCASNIGAACYSGNHITPVHWRVRDSWAVGNRFYNNAQGNIDVQTDGGDPVLDNNAIISNVFGQPCVNQGSVCDAVSALALISSDPTGTLPNNLVAYNDIANSLYFSDHGGTNLGVGTLFFGNIDDGILGNTCATTNQGVLYRYNQHWTNNNPLQNATCDATEALLSSNPWNSTTTGDFTLSSAGASAVGNLIPTSVVAGSFTIACPSFDYAGNPRPKPGNTKCAAGPYEPGS